MGFFDIFKTKKNTSNKSSSFDENSDIENEVKLNNEVKNYWAQIISGDIKLENGEIFNDNNFYNSKYLKYKPDIIYRSLIALALSGNSDDKFKQICQVGAMSLACFDDNIKGVIKTSISQNMEISKKYKGKKTKKELLAMAKEVAATKEVEPYTHDKLQNLKKQKAVIFGKQVSI
jgi:hypothetical protein